MSANTASVVWLTQEAYDKLTNELEYLKGEGRTEISAKIASAREEGDLSENGGYHAAREEQGQMEARIRQLEDMLRRAEVGEAPTSGDEVVPGTMVTVAYFGDEDDTDTFLLGSREVMGLDDSVEDIQVYSPQSPLGSAIVGKRVGEDADYVAPTGKTISVTIVKVEPFSG
ncbi:transcription elongation factor GreA [Aestuariimicrobium sp. p3-SID1156]|uniref:transcription elongation factor GreA n=1 Tax=Aestuariimicrobium sp. p3-SID1156 TaxID=2916038 RepID=UPI00223AC3D1|nr:transcription elongation factor GreA [Aestuariimicrobium sp. p3-SID1156]MCT1458838.1 transcription elongation factor GreA [Aestuariimicrobium sp. p3-SID1156]